MNFAAITTIVAVFENIMAFSMDLFHWTRKRACIVNFVLITLLSIPCALGFSILSGIQPFGAGSAILDLEDFLVSNVIMPLGAVLIILFCTTNAAGAGSTSSKKRIPAKGFISRSGRDFILVIFCHVRYYLSSSWESSINLHKIKADLQSVSQLF